MAARRSCWPPTASGATCAGSAARATGSCSTTSSTRSTCRTGLVVFEWHSVGQVGLDESRTRPEGDNSWDYFHVNSVEVDTDGNLIISARNTCALYKLSRTTGEIIWRMGGRQSDFRMGEGSRFGNVLGTSKAIRP
ncbi:MAG: arylsulfotransferase family protein [Solirubrobacteraceae bacterium]